MAQLYRDCLRLADYISTRVCWPLHRPLLPAAGHPPARLPACVCLPARLPSARSRARLHTAGLVHVALKPGSPDMLQGGNRRVLRDQVRLAFKKNKDETDPQKIEEQKEA